MLFRSVTTLSAEVEKSKGYIARAEGAAQAAKAADARKVTFVLEKEQTRFVKFSVSMGFFVGHVYGELVDSAVGLEEIKECKYTGAEEAPK